MLIALFVCVVAAGALLQRLHAGVLADVSPRGVSTLLPIHITGTGFDRSAKRNVVSFLQGGTVVGTAIGKSLVDVDRGTGQRRLTVDVPAAIPVGATALLVRNEVTGETSEGASVEIIAITLPEIVAAARGNNKVDVRIDGSPNTIFPAGGTTVAFGQGITTRSVTVTSPTSLVASISIDRKANAGLRSVYVETTAQSAILEGAFAVTTEGGVNYAPAAHAGGPYAGVAGTAIRFDGTGSSDPDGDPLAYNWDFGDGQKGTGAAPTHIYATGGQFAVTLTVTDGRNGTSTASTIATINGVPVARPGGPYAADTGQSIAFDGRASSDPDGDALTYAWDFGDGGTGTGATPTHTYKTSGSFTVSLTVDDGRGGSHTAAVGAKISDPAPQNQAPTANAGGPYTGIVGVAVSFDASASSDPDGDTLTYSWDFGDGGTGTGATPTHTYKTSGSFTVSLTVDDGRGGAHTAAVGAKISDPAPQNQAPTAHAGGPYTGTVGVAVSFDASASSDPDGDTLTFTWDFGDGGTGTGATPTHTYKTAGSFTVSLTVNDGRGGTHTATVGAKIGDPLPQNQAPTANAGGPYSGTVGVAVSFDASASSDPDGDTLTFTWNFGDGGTGTGAAPTHNYKQTGDYKISLTASDGRGGIHTAATTAVISPPSPVNRPPLAHSGGPYSGLAGQQVSFDGRGSSDADGDTLTYGWDFGDGGTGTGAAPSHTYAQAGNYKVSVTVSDGRGGSDTAATVADVAPPAQSNRTPVANPGGPYSSEVNVLVSLDASLTFDPDGDALTFSWTYGDGAQGTGRLTKHAYAASGDYTVTLNVSDGRGGTDSATATVRIAEATDHMPPVVTLNGPREALPGTQVTMTAQAVDNVSVASVDFEVTGGSPSSIPQSPYQRTVQIPSVAAPGDTIEVTALARDPSGNTASAKALITIVAAPDTTAPVVTLNAPAQIGRGSNLLVSAQASDAVGVAEVTFVIDGQTTVIEPGKPLVATFAVAADRALDSSIPVLVRAKDFAGNTGEAVATVVVVAEQDTTPPTVTRTAPEEVGKGGPLTITAAVKDDVGVASVELIINGVVVQTVTSPPFTLDFLVPESLLTGALLDVKIVVRDFSGNTAETTASITVTENSVLTRSLVTGEVYDDTTGLPLEGAAIVVKGADGYLRQAASDSRGRFAVPAPAGSAVVTVSKDGWTRSVREVSLAADTATEMFDARLTRRASAGPAVSPVLGGRVEQDGFDLELTGGALTDAADLRLTPLTQQGIVALLPSGWSPVAAVDISPGSLTFVGPQVLRSPNRPELAGRTLAVARFDDQQRVWGVIQAGAVAGDGTLPAANVPGGGQYVWLVADTTPGAPPAAVAGEPLSGTGSAAIPEGATAVINPQPRVIFYKPGVFSNVGNRVAGSQALQSGAPVQVRISESYRFFSGVQQHPEPFTQDFVLFQAADASGAVEAHHRVTPSLTFEALALELGVITLDLETPTPGARVTPLIGVDGGVASGVTGEEFRLPPHAGADETSFGLQRLTADQLGLTLPASLAFVGGVSVSFNGVLQQSGVLSIPRPAGLLDASGVLLARVQPIAGEDRLVLVAAARLVGERLESDTSLGDNPRAFEGITVGGRYVFVRPTTLFGFITGPVLGVDGNAFTGALVSTPTLPLVALSRSVGYVAAGAVGTVPLAALDVIRLDSGAGQGVLTAPRSITTVPLSLTANPPTVLSVTPADQATNVPLGTAVVARFSRPIDPATAQVASSVTLSGPGGGSIAGSIVWSLNGTMLTFRPTASLEPNAQYTFALTTALRDLTGRPLAGASTTTFGSLDTNPPPVPPAGSITAGFPDVNGRATVRGTQGTAGRTDTVTIFNVTRGTSSPVILDPDGGFLALVDASLSDKLRVRIVDAAGNEIFVDLARFRQVNADGSVSTFVGPEGGKIEGPNGTAVDVPVGAFPDGVKMTLTYVPEAQFPIQLSAEDDGLFSYSGGLALDLNGQSPTIYLNLSMPAAATDGPEDQWIVGYVLPVGGQNLFNMVDRARVIDGRIATSSPPCPGVLAQGTYAFVKSTRPVGVNAMRAAIRTKAVAAAAIASISNLILAGATATRFASNGIGGAMVGVAVVGITASTPFALNAYDVCYPTLTGRASISENVVRITVPVEQIRPNDRLITVTNATTNDKRTFARGLANLTVEVPGIVPDWYEVVGDAFGSPTQDLGSTGPDRFRDPAFSIAEGADRKTLITVQGDALLITPIRLTVHQVFQRLKGSGTDLGELGAEFAVRGSATDTYEVYTGSSHISGELVTISPGAAAGEVRIRIAPAPLANLDPVNTDFQIKHVTVKEVDGTGPIQFTIEGISGDQITVDLTDSFGSVRRVQPQIQASAAGSGRLVLKVLKATIDPAGVPIVEGSSILRAPSGVTLEGVGGGTVPESAITHGGVAGWSFPGQLGTNYKLHIDYLSDGKIDPLRRITELIATMSLSVLNLETGEILKTIERPTPPRDEPVYLGPLSDDSEPPALLTSESDLKLIDPLHGITLRFSESMDPRSLKNGIVVRDSNGNIVEGEIRISDQNRLVTFIPASGMKLGSSYTITFEVQDVSGNLLPITHSTRTLTTFTPTRLSTLATVPGGAPMQLLQDITTHAVDLGDRQEQYIVGVTRGSRFVSEVEGLRRGSTSKLLTMNVTNPAGPESKGAAGITRFAHSANWRVHIVKDVDEPLYQPVNPPPDHPTDEPRKQFKGDLAVVSRASVEVSILEFFDITNPNAPRSLDEKVLSANPGVNLLVDTRRGAHQLPGYVRGLTSLKTTEGLMIYAAVQDAGIMAVQFRRHLRTPPPLERIKAPIASGNYFDVVAIRGRLAAVNNETEQLDILSPDLALLGSVSLGQPSHNVVAVPGYAFDFDKDGQLEAHENRDLVIVGGRDMITIVDVTAQGSPVVTGTIGVVTPTHSTLDFNPARGWLVASVVPQPNHVARAALIELGDPRRFGLIDQDNDSRDDRVIWLDEQSPDAANAVQAARFDGQGRLFVSRSLPFVEDYRGQLEVWSVTGDLAIDGRANGGDSAFARIFQEVEFSAVLNSRSCDPADITWTFGDGSTAKGLKATHAYTHADGYRVTVTAVCPGSRVASDTVPVSIAAGLSVKGLWSAQLGDDIRVNAIPDGTGGDRPRIDYIMVGARKTNQLHIGLEVTPIHNDREKLAALVPEASPGPWAGQSFTSSQVMLTRDLTGQVEVTPYIVRVGFDLNGDGLLQPIEEIDSRGRILAVSQEAFDRALADSRTRYKRGFVTPQAQKNFGLFLGEVQPSELGSDVRIGSHTLVKDAPGLTHNTGAEWKTPSVEIARYTYEPTSQLAQDFAGSSLILADWVRGLLGNSRVKARLERFFIDNPTLSDGVVQLDLCEWGMLNPDALQRALFFDPDAALATGAASFTGTVKLRIQRQGSNAALRSATIEGRIDDLFDWNYDLYGSQDGAIVQAGYGTLSTTAGKIFSVSIDVNAVVEPSLLFCPLGCFFAIQPSEVPPAQGTCQVPQR